MRIQKHPFHRTLAAVAAAAVFTTQALFADAAERGFWSERAESVRRARESSAQAERLSRHARELMAGLTEPAPVRPAWAEEAVTRALLPGSADLSAAPVRGDLTVISRAVSRVAGLGTLRSVRGPAAPAAGSPVVVFLQDVHGVPSAQTNIAQAVLKLAEEDPALVVGLEGAAGPVDASPFRGPSDKVNRQLGELLFKADLIAGPELAAFAAPAGVRFVGVEDPALYLRNVRVVEKVFPGKDATAALIAEGDRRAGTLKEALWPEALRTLDRRRADRESGRLPLSGYVDFLAAHSPGGALKDLPQIALFRAVRDKESALDFPAIGRERTALLSRLSERLRAGALEGLLEAGVSLRSGRLSPAAYYRSFNETVRRAGLAPSDFPLFQKYVEYVVAADAVRPEDFGKEVRTLEERLARALCGTPAQKELLAASADLALAAKLAGLRMTPDEWRDYASRRDAVRDLPARLARLEGAAPAGGKEGSFSFLDDLEEFYRVAEARNAALAVNLMDAFRRAPGTTASGGQPLGILVCGGFHTEGLTDILVRRGAWVATVSPKIDPAELSSARDPLAAFTRAPTPVEKLFEAPKPSLVTEVALGGNLQTGPARRMRRVIEGLGPAVLLLLSRLGVNQGEPAPDVRSPGLARAAEGMRVGPGGAYAAARVDSWGSDGSSRGVDVVVASPGVRPQSLPRREAALFEGGTTVLAVDGGEGGPSLTVNEEKEPSGWSGKAASALGRAAAAMKGGIPSRASVSRRAGQAASLTLSLLMATLLSGCYRSATGPLPSLAPGFLLAASHWWSVAPQTKLVLLVLIPAGQMLVLAGLWVSNALRKGNEREWRRSKDGVLPNEMSPAPTAEETAWREALQRASTDGLTPELLSAMMDSSWYLRGRHKIPDGGLNSANQKTAKAAKAELERLYREALRSARLCADALSEKVRWIREGKGTGKNGGISEDDEALIRQLLTGCAWFRALGLSFGKHEVAYGLFVDACFWRSSYGAKSGAWSETVWRWMRRRLGMQQDIVRKLKLLPNAERQARQAANVLDSLYAEEQGKPLKPGWASLWASIEPESALVSMSPTQEDGNKVRKLLARLNTFFVSLPISGYSYWGNWSMLAFSVGLNFWAAVLYQRGLIRVTNSIASRKRALLRREMEEAWSQAKAAALSVRIVPPELDKESLRRATLAVESEETSDALFEEMDLENAPSVDVVVLAPRDRDQWSYFNGKAKDRSLFRSDVPVLVLDPPAPQGLESGVAAMNALSAVTERWEGLQRDHPHLDGLSPSGADIVVGITGESGVGALDANPQRDTILQGSRGSFRTVFDLSMANAYRTAQAQARAGKRGGVSLAYVDRASLGHLSVEEPGVTLRTAWASLREVESQDLTVVTTGVDGSVRKVFARFNSDDKAFLSYDLANPESRQFEVFAGSAVMRFPDGDAYEEILALFKDLEAYMKPWGEKGVQGFHLVSSFLVPLSILSRQMDEETLETEVGKYLQTQETEAKHRGEKGLGGFYTGMTGIFIKHRRAAMPFHVPHTSGFSTFYARSLGAGSVLKKSRQNGADPGGGPEEVVLLRPAAAAVPAAPHAIHWPISAKGVVVLTIVLGVGGALLLTITLFPLWRSGSASTGNGFPQPPALPAPRNGGMGTNSLQPGTGGVKGPAGGPGGAAPAPAKIRRPAPLRPAERHPAAEAAPSARPAAPAAPPALPAPLVRQAPAVDPDVAGVLEDVARRRREAEPPKKEKKPARPDAGTGPAGLLPPSPAPAGSSDETGEIHGSLSKTGRSPLASAEGRAPSRIPAKVVGGLVGLGVLLAILMSPRAARAQEAALRARENPVHAVMESSVEADPAVLQARVEAAAKSHKTVGDWARVVLRGVPVNFRREWAAATAPGVPGNKWKWESFPELLVSPAEVAKASASGAAGAEAAAQERAKEKAAAMEGLVRLLDAHGEEGRVAQSRRMIESLRNGLDLLDPRWKEDRGEAQRAELQRRFVESSRQPSEDAAGKAQEIGKRLKAVLAGIQLENLLELQKRELAAAEAARDGALGRLAVAAPGVPWDNGTGLPSDMDLSALELLVRAEGAAAMPGELEFLDAKVARLQQEAAALAWSQAPYLRFLGVARGDSASHFLNRFDVWSLAGWKPTSLLAAPAPLEAKRSELRAWEAYRDEVRALMEKDKRSAEAGLRDAQERARAQSSVVGTAQRSLDAALEAFGDGRASIDAVKDALTALADALAGAERLRAEGAAHLRALAAGPAKLPAAPAARRAPAAFPVTVDLQAGLGWTLRNNGERNPEAGFLSPDNWIVTVNAEIKGLPFSVVPAIYLQAAGPADTSKITRSDAPGPNFTGGLKLTWEAPPARPAVENRMKDAAAEPARNAPPAPSAEMAPRPATVEAWLARAAELNADVRTARAAVRAAEEGGLPGNPAGLTVKAGAFTGNKTYPKAAAGFPVDYTNANTGVLEVPVVPAAAVERFRAGADVARARAKAEQARNKAEQEALESLGRYAAAMAVADLGGDVDALVKTQSERQRDAARKAADQGADPQALASAQKNLEAQLDRLQAPVRKARETMEQIARRWGATPEDMNPSARDLLNRAAVAQGAMVADMTQGGALTEGHPDARLARATEEQTLGVLQALAGVVGPIGPEYKGKRAVSGNGKPGPNVDQLGVKSVLNPAALFDVFAAVSDTDDARKATGAVLTRVVADIRLAARETDGAARRLEAARAYVRITEETLRVLSAVRSADPRAATLGDELAAARAVLEARISFSEAEAAEKAARTIQREKLRRARGSVARNGADDGFILLGLLPQITAAGAGALWGAHLGLPVALAAPGAFFLAVGLTALGGMLWRSGSSFLRWLARRVSSPASLVRAGAARWLPGFLFLFALAQPPLFLASCYGTKPEPVADAGSEAGAPDAGTAGTGVPAAGGSSGKDGGTAGTGGKAGTAGTAGIDAGTEDGGKAGSTGTGGNPGTGGMMGGDAGMDDGGKGGSTGTGGKPGTGGMTMTGGDAGVEDGGKGGSTGTGGKPGTGGMTATGGNAGMAGMGQDAGAAGTSGTGGASATGGMSGTGGTAGTAGTSGTGGASGTGGMSGSGGTSGTGGMAGTGGTGGMVVDRLTQVSYNAFEKVQAVDSNTWAARPDSPTSSGGWVTVQVGALSTVLAVNAPIGSVVEVEAALDPGVAGDVTAGNPFYLSLQSTVALTVDEQVASGSVDAGTGVGQEGIAANTPVTLVGEFPSALVSGATKLRLRLPGGSYSLQHNPADVGSLRSLGMMALAGWIVFMAATFGLSDFFHVLSPRGFALVAGASLLGIRVLGLPSLFRFHEFIHQAAERLKSGKWEPVVLRVGEAEGGRAWLRLMNPFDLSKTPVVLHVEAEQGHSRLERAASLLSILTPAAAAAVLFVSPFSASVGAWTAVVGLAAGALATVFTHRTDLGFSAAKPPASPSGDVSPPAPKGAVDPRLLAVLEVAGEEGGARLLEGRPFLDRVGEAAADLRGDLAFHRKFVDAVRRRAPEAPARRTASDRFWSLHLRAVGETGAAAPAAPGAPAVLTLIVGRAELAQVRKTAALWKSVHGDDPLKRMILVAGENGVQGALKALAAKSGGAVEFMDEVRPTRSLDRGFVRGLNDGLKRRLDKMGVDRSRMAVAASPGLPWSLASKDDLEGLDVDALRDLLLKILDHVDHPAPADYGNMLEVLAAVVEAA